MKLYELPMGTRVRIRQENGDYWFTIKDSEGMYAYLEGEDGTKLHLSETTKVVEVESEGKTFYEVARDD
ncbi:MAG TPA: hypothetical protein VJ836_00580 [Candidatus Saccharimonadales bacterium]|nr:hypothetical protein [Candidatus Saccharimonadales bacterium]